MIAFVSLPVCQVSDSFHRVELVQSRLSPFGRALSRVVFDLLSFAFCALLLWQLTRFEMSSFRFGDRAPTYLATPLWIPQAVMALGAAALCFSMVRTLAADIAGLRRARVSRRSGRRFAEKDTRQPRKADGGGRP